MATQKKTSTRKKTSGKKATTARKKQSSSVQTFTWRAELLLFAFLALTILLFIGNIGKGGVVGNAFSNVSFGLFGVLAYLFPIPLFLIPAFLVSNRQNSRRGPAYSGRVIMKVTAGVLLFLFLCVFAHIVCWWDQAPHKVTALYIECAGKHTGGGVIGGLIGILFTKSFGMMGAVVLDLLILVVCVVLLTERSFFKGVSKGGRKVYESARVDAARRKTRAQERSRERSVRREERRTAEEKRRMDRKVSGVALDTKIYPQQTEEKGTDNLTELSLDPKETAKKNKTARNASKVDIPTVQDVPVQESGDITQAQSDDFWAQHPQPEIHLSGEQDPYQEPQKLARMEIQPKAASQPKIQVQDAAVPEPEADVQSEMKKKSHRAGQPKQSAEQVEQEIADVRDEIAEHAENVARTYVFPEISLLQKGDPNMTGDSRQHLQEMSAKLQMTLTNFGVNARVTNVICGPTVTQYEIQPEMGVKVSKILGLADDIKLNLAVPDIRFEAPIPGKSAIGIEVPNKENVTIAFRDLVESREFQDHASKISFCTGKDIAGHVIVADIAKMPHLLIAGATGSGKSVCINTIIMSILYKAKPDEVKLIMIDPKVVELSVYNGIPHLLIPVVTDPKKAAGALHWAVSEMMERYQTFQKYGVRDMKGYNKKVESIQDLPGEDKPKKMPQIVIIVDELADLMMVASNDVEDAICRLAQLARAAGMHLVIATQRPSVNVITGLIKANMPSRIAFAVTSGVDSRTILDMNGAEKLLGKGDMLFYPQNYQKPLRVQGAFVTDKEVSDVVEYIIEKNGQVAYNAEVEEKVNTSENSIGGGSGFINSTDDRDAYFADAGKFIIEKEKGSIGMLQRMFKIGFNRAARIMDQLEEAGVVGPEEGTKPRRVLMNLEEFQQVLSGSDD
ncbi:DNA translocase FtsK [uncultured Eubacterium sp.]|uniref:DNA translocase FtsK n=1 Tax=uncultured Eubacterium sp. TaxID=165185 RepID=UPI002600B8DE|nr:DNA translocase FtsK [uncultured Eubacterium sp.]